MPGQQAGLSNTVRRCALSSFVYLIVFTLCVWSLFTIEYYWKFVKMKVSVISVALFAATVAAHGLIINPPSRKLGPSMTRLCGQTAFDIAKGDVTASLETVAPNITAGCQCYRNTKRRFPNANISSQALSLFAAVTNSMTTWINFPYSDLARSSQ